jgi:hypothetical protein
MLVSLLIAALPLRGERRTISLCMLDPACCPGFAGRPLGLIDVG